MENNIKKGVILSLITAVISGIAIFYNKQVLVKGIDPLIFNIIKNGGTALILSFFILGRNPRISSLSRRHLDKFDKRLILIGLIGGSLPFILYFQGLTESTPVVANLIHKTLFIWVAIFSVSVLKEKLSYYQIIGYLLIIFANFFIGGLTQFKFGVPEIFILSATLLWSFENIIAKIVLKKTESSTVAWGRMTFGTVFLIFIAVISGKAQLIWQVAPEQILPISGSIILLTLYVITWYKALKYAPATLVTSILILATPVTNFLSAVTITRDFSPIISVNSLAVLTGVILISVITSGKYQSARKYYQ
ncbi:hypothetical protein A3D05_05485 [Candidatus Gottesmanbacteria bacterium RIFCSPHIGHO2_02_FULL_40_24]|uniref:EamA domain-containing protein n=1 Tax=Candidatus Gottesmanbacteria bacterium RIFCSPHIGHO2_01_FULL_40_15 TaxID=1798376 RepID=A0A1F5Z6U9_9BACT|nr:MAG: hypothetical protein A2777_02120 [Candidatus Gottesmanbacteria bacterium RIFCSPHIGHO2_01_FULL_40_15]OGG16482.1 MAG: hypothetical protein A3D05_05485 [Candidatus Gottesmanbacteria bacterium RIFCSPHIGHO2_02_FULL_40_24]OGG22762.1 MAG: hypothetical protein A3B48_03115 [Candidatus Gottesmanbacteria bacterium RIFCSPLOWO2_01_FULL_40_10]OGG25595.1 MAG: hypothetical protein A3E42_04635 [Candidatus Gottesmanbacteria bacterium RIFCSPHIGHO2_12_FULL_40_13]OGG32600.1 MAG: hypothetical protein A3I80_0